MRMPPQLWPVYQDRHRQERLGQAASRPRVVGPVQAADLALLVNPLRVVEAAVAAEAVVAAEAATVEEVATAADMDTETAVDMDTETAEADTVAVAVAVMARASVMAISAMGMATSAEGANKAKDLLRRQDELCLGIPLAAKYGWQGLVLRRYLAAAR
ncbi:MAG: hypothetical protein WB819_02590 [Terriglobia bacterium]